MALYKLRIIIIILICKFQTQKGIKAYKLCLWPAACAFLIYYPMFGAYFLVNKLVGKYQTIKVSDNDSSHFTGNADGLAGMADKMSLQ